MESGDPDAGTFGRVIYVTLEMPRRDGGGGES
jgi:hypothetical protein